MPKLQIVKLSDTPTPRFATKFSAGMDLHAVIPGGDNTVHISPGGVVLVGTGLLIQPEEGYCVKLYPRSGLAYKLKLNLANCVGIIDRDYSKEVMVIMHNHSRDHVTIYHGERICQMEMHAVVPINIEVVNSLPIIDSDRDGGMGSTGK